MQRESADRKPSAALLEAKKRARENKNNEKMVEGTPLKDIYSNVSKTMRLFEQIKIISKFLFVGYEHR